MALSEIIIYTKPSCCLCTKVWEQLTKLQEQYSFAIREINILEDSEAYNKFKEEIPVIFVNGKKAFKYHLDEKAFICMIKSCDTRQQPGSASGN